MLRGIPLLIGLLAALPSAAAEHAVARAKLRGGASAGVVFFLRLAGEPGAVAVGSAHAFDRTLLAEAGLVDFRVAERDTPVASASRYLTKPGVRFGEAGATLRDDFVTFALEGAPRNVRILTPAEGLPRPGDRVRVLGPPGHGTEAPVRGAVLSSEPTQIEVILDAWADLRGWGGAPVVSEADGRVIALLQSLRSDGQQIIAGVGPIGGVLAALAQPYEGGLGRLFATLAPPPSAATDPAGRRRAVTGSPYGDQAVGKRTAEVAAALERAELAPRPRAPRALRLEIELPRSGAIVGDAAGVFLAGRALALDADTRRFDIVIAIDTSLSTRAPTGVDVDGDGSIGEPVADPPSPVPLSSDPGDTILAAELAAAAKLLAGLDPRSTRVGLLTFAGQPAPLRPGATIATEVRHAAQTHEPLTSDYRRLRLALERLRERGAAGMTHMAAGIDQATLELLGLEGSLSSADPESEKIVLFFTDGQPTLPDLRSEAGNVRAVLASATRARRAGVHIHSFAIGPEALEGPIAAVEMAAISAGRFTAVRDPGSLVRFIETTSFANIAEMSAVNTTTGQSAYQVRVHADGSWDALVPLEPGENRLEVRARSADGALAVAESVVRHTPGAEGPPLPAELVFKYNELLSTRLAALGRDRAEVVRRELILEMERERAAAVERAARQRKELEIEIERPE